MAPWSERSVHRPEHWHTMCPYSVFVVLTLHVGMWLWSCIMYLWSPEVESLVRLRGACRMAYIPASRSSRGPSSSGPAKQKNIWSAPTTHNHIWPRLSAVDGSRYDGSRTIYPSLKSVARGRLCLQPGPRYVLWERPDPPSLLLQSNLFTVRLMSDPWGLPSRQLSHPHLLAETRNSYSEVLPG